VAFVLLRLRLAIQRGARHRAGALGRIGYVISWSAAGILGILAGFGVALLDDLNTTFGDLLLVAAFTLVFSVWLIAPLMVPGAGGGVVDPVKLEQYPLTFTEQVTGLLLGGLVAPSALFTFLFAAGGTIADGYDAVSRIAVAIAAVLFTILCLAGSNALQALVGGAVSSRRGRDAVIILTGAIVLGLYLLLQSLGGVLAAVGPAAGPIGAVLSWFPPGAAGAITIAARDDAWADAALRTVVVVVTVALALVVWGWALSRHRRGAASSSRRATQPAGADGELSLVPPLLRSLPGGPLTAVVSQQLRYYFFRAPKAVQFLAITPVLGVVLAHSQIEEQGLVFGAAVFIVLTASGAMVNVFAHDGAGVEYTVLSGASLRSALTGKLIAPMVFIVPLLIALVLVEAAITGTWQDVGIALIAGLAALAATTAICAFSSAFNGFDQSSPVSSRGRAIIGVLIAVGVAYGVVIGVAYVWAALGAVIPMNVVGLVSFALAVIAAVIAVRIAGGALDRSPDRLLARFATR
jgi:ABC-2 type transport system permease protein